MYKNLDLGRDFTAIYLDISKYFDKIWHKGLLKKCAAEFGLTGTLNKWISSYLKDRNQMVKIGSAVSAPQNLNAGCPQGSVLGPLLALIYLNGLADLTDNDTLFFADDTSIHSPHTPQTLLTAQQSLQTDLDKIYQYGQQWAITFNASKTIQQSFSRKQNPQTPKLTFGNQPVPVNTSHTHLGLTYSSDLRFHEHTNKTIQKLNRALSPLYPIARYLPRNILAQIFKMYVQPYFDYCDVVYDGHLTLHDEHRLQTIQNRAGRLITGAHFRTPITKLLQDLGWDSLTTRRKINRLAIYHRLQLRNSKIPQFIRDILTNTRLHDTGRHLRNASTQTLPQNRTTSYQRSFVPATSREWNKLPETTRLIEPPKLFKTAIVRRLGAKRPPPYYALGSKFGNILHTRLRVETSCLNAHRYRILLTETPFCSCGYRSEDTIHFTLSCPLYAAPRTHLFQSLNTILNNNFSTLSPATQINSLVCGTGISAGDGVGVAAAFQNFLLASNRFNPI